MSALSAIKKKAEAQAIANNPNAKPEAREISAAEIERLSERLQGETAVKLTGGTLDMRKMKRSDRQYRLHTKITYEAREHLVRVAIAKKCSLSEALEEAIKAYNG